MTSGGTNFTNIPESGPAETGPAGLVAMTL